MKFLNHQDISTSPASTDAIHVKEVALILVGVDTVRINIEHMIETEQQNTNLQIVFRSISNSNDIETL